MKKLFTLVFLFLIFNGFSQEVKLKEYSHTEFFNMIKAEKDSVFSLQDAFISFTKKDSAFAYQLIGGTYQFKTSDTIFIDKIIELVNVHFEHNNDDIGQQVGFPFIVFNKDVIIADTTSMLFFNCVFKGVLEVDVNTLGNDQINKLDKKHLEYEPHIGFYNTTFNNDVILSIGSLENYSSISFKMFNNTFISEENRIRKSCFNKQYQRYALL